MMKDVKASITMETILKEKVSKTNAYSSKFDKSITLGRVEGSVEAIRAALQILDGGGKVEDAKAVCEPGLLAQIMKWRSKLRVYLAPFLYGMRYTSYGRHFTKVEKLKEVSLNYKHICCQKICVLLIRHSFYPSQASIK
ncbi:protein ENHANCED DOWNY MILDEW 2-like [Capsicum annuum]|uniref:protein ENHANCED DOWNY MILDEW 2-like n=1 Tax=Capsicum annuum TaxID=4072 RepID=UPI001FB04F77|nr:protein ENHANCED DOWNY MILDEW 2-like [Capsicum annuum]